jgi:nicotinamidase-related amidase
MRSIEPHRTRRFDLDPDRAALLVVDAQRYFLDPRSRGCMPWAPQVVGRIQELQARFRGRGRPVVFTRHAHEPDGSDGGNLAWWWHGLLRDGEPDAELVPEVAPRPGELVVRKRTYSAFLGTGLDEALRGSGVTDLVIAGVMTNLCCETSAREAFCRGFRVKFVADATSTEDEAMQLATLRNLAFGFADVCLAEDLLGPP